MNRSEVQRRETVGWYSHRRLYFGHVDQSAFGVPNPLCSLGSEIAQDFLHVGDLSENWGHIFGRGVVAGSQGIVVARHESLRFSDASRHINSHQGFSADFFFNLGFIVISMTYAFTVQT